MPLPVDASMEPRSVERGMKLRNRSQCHGRELQWSRVRLNAEWRLRIELAGVQPELQWSRVRLNAEWLRNNHPRQPPLGASMEPRSVERGMIYDPEDPNTYIKLQWSRVRLNAECGEDRFHMSERLRLQWSRVRLNAE